MTQPRVLSRTVDALGRVLVIDEEGEHLLPDQRAGGTVGVSNNSSGLNTEIRWWASDDPGNNRSLVYSELWARRNSSTTYGNGSWCLYIAGVQGCWSGTKSIGTGWVHIMSHSVWVGHSANGTGSAWMDVSGGIPGTSWTSTWGGFTAYLTDYVVLPYAPYDVRVRAGSVTTTSFGVDYGRNSHDPFDRPDQAEWALDPGFSNIVWRDEGPQGYTDPSGGAGPALTPGTTHYVRIRHHTSAGWGPWSVTVSQVTLPATPPGLTPVAMPSGTAATLTFTPPGGVTGVSLYLWERRLQGTTTPVATGSTGTTVAEVDGLTPGSVYEWRGSAMIGTYQSPWTGWIPLQQPRPNTSPGDYFDGDTTDTPSLDYGWTGTPENSTSRAVGRGVDGWEAAFSQSAVGTLHQVVGGYVNANAARVLVQIDATGPGAVEGGQGAGFSSEIAENTTYVGSMYVNPSRSQRMRAILYWLDAGGAVMSPAVGADQVLPGGVWTRLVVSAVSPAGAASAIVRVHDATGSGHVPWKSGEFFLMDAAMISLAEEFTYFDGNTPDTETTVYGWLGTENASVSTATPAGIAGVGTLSGLEKSSFPGTLSLVDPDCEPVPAPPRPPVVPSDCIEDVGIWRRYYVSIPAINVSDWLAVVLTLEVITGAVAARQVRIRVYPNPFDSPPEQVNTGEWCAEQIISYMPPSTVLTLDGVTMRAWAEVNDTTAQSADHLLYGTGGQPPTWPILSCGISYLVSLEVPIDAPEGNISANAFVTVRS